MSTYSVMDVLRGMAMFAASRRAGRANAAESGMREEAALAAVAELVAADRGYDEAYRKWVSWGRPASGKVRAAFEQAEQRRADALAVMGDVA